MIRQPRILETLALPIALLPMAPAFRLERKSADLESAVLTFERHRNIYKTL